jgi:hypothetical protein
MVRRSPDVAEDEVADKVVAVEVAAEVERA